MRIVIVEDEAPIRKGLAGILGCLDDSYEVVGIGENGRQGLELIKETKPDLIIMDIQMPQMDGLTMLEKVREEGIESRAIVLSAYSDFEYAQKAIALGILNYLLKPIKLPELKKVLKEAEEVIGKEQSKEQIISLENLFLSGVGGNLESDPHMEELLKERYGIDSDEEIAILGIQMDKQYDNYHDSICSMLERVDMHNKDFRSYCIDIKEQRFVALLIYRIADMDKLFDYFQKKIIPMLQAQVPEALLCTWGTCQGMFSIRYAVSEMESYLEWNLCFDRGTLLGAKVIEEMEPQPVKYPADLEEEVKQAVADYNQKQFDSAVWKLRDYCKEKKYVPKDIKEICSRMALVLVQRIRSAGKLEETAVTQDIVKNISDAIRWTDIRDAFGKIWSTIESKHIEENVSTLIQNAISLIQEYYGNGLTLEELAGKLHVTDEYLSSQFKKETGKTFSETIRQYRMEKVKELLVESSLKLNQIADIVGYSDPKYMSKVFKEEVGMTPAEYRKQQI